MDFTIKPTNSTPEMTAEIASNAYSKIKEFGNIDLAFKAQTDSSIEPEHFVKVDNEADRLIREINSFMGGKLLSAEEFHYDEESMEKVIDKKEVRYIPTTKTDLIKQLSSDFLDVELILNDYISGTWTEFKESFEGN